MIHFSDNLFCTEKIRPDADKIKLKLYSGIGTVGICFITLSENDNDLFDIYPAANLKQRLFRKKDIYIIGLAESKKAAMKLTGELIASGIQKTSDHADLKAYFEEMIKW